MEQLTLSRKYLQDKIGVMGIFSSGSTIFHISGLDHISKESRPEASNVISMRYFELSDDIEAFHTLTANWDSYNADPISKDAISAAKAILEHLSIKGVLSTELNIHVFPMRDGGVQFEFDSDSGESIEIEIGPNGDMTYICFDAEGSITSKTQLYEISTLAELLSESCFV